MLSLRARGWSVLLLALLASPTLAIDPPPASLAPRTLFRQLDLRAFKYGYVDDALNNAIPARFGTADNFKDGFAVVSEGTGDKRRYGTIDASGNFIIPLSSRVPLDFHEGLSRFKDAADPGALFTYVDTTGKPAFLHSFQEADAFHEGLALVGDGKSWWFIDKTGNRIVEPPGPGRPLPFSEGLSSIKTAGDAFLVFDKRGRELFRLDCKGIGPFGSGLAPFCESLQKWGYVDRAGKIVIEPAYQLAKPFCDGRAAVRSNGMWGYIDATGKARTPAIYKEADDFSGGVARVKHDGLWGILDHEGQWLIPPLYRSLEGPVDRKVLADRPTAAAFSDPRVLALGTLRDTNPDKVKIPPELIALLCTTEWRMPRNHPQLAALPPDQRDQFLQAARRADAAKDADAVATLKALFDKKILAAGQVLGALYATGHGIKPDYFAARVFLDPAALAGDGYSCWIMAHLYYAGKGVEPDITQVLFYAQRALQEEPAGYRYMGLLYLDGRLTDVAPAEAAKAIYQGAQKNDVVCILAIGLMLEQGIGLPANPADALKAYKALADAGIPEGMLRTARLMDKLGDKDGARAWYQKVAPVSEEARQRLQGFAAPATAPVIR